MKTILASPNPRCPSCKGETDGVVSADAQATNYALLEAVQALVLQRDAASIVHSPVPCDVCITKKVSPLGMAVKKCMDCGGAKGKWMCEKHLEAHGEAMDEHTNVLSPEEVAAGARAAAAVSPSSKASSSVVKCVEHDDVCRLFCESCEIPICSTCVGLDICKDHKKVLLADAMKKQRGEVADKADQAEQFHAKLTEQIGAVVTMIERVAGKETELVTQINEVEEAMVGRVRAAMEERRQEVMKMCAERRKILVTQQDELECAQASMRSVVETTRRALEHGSDGAVVSTKKPMMEAMKRVETVMKEGEEPKADDNVSLRVAEGGVGRVGEEAERAVEVVEED